MRRRILSASSSSAASAVLCRRLLCLLRHRLSASSVSPAPCQLPCQPLIAVTPSVDSTRQIWGFPRLSRRQPPKRFAVSAELKPGRPTMSPAHIPARVPGQYHAARANTGDSCLGTCWPMTPVCLLSRPPPPYRCGVIPYSLVQSGRLPSEMMSTAHRPCRQGTITACLPQRLHTSSGQLPRGPLRVSGPWAVVYLKSLPG